MRWTHTLPLRLRSLFRAKQADAEIDEELQLHLDWLIQKGIDKGLPEHEARRSAMLELGGIQQRKEECRDARKINWLSDAVQDVRYGFRMLRRTPAFTAVAILSLTLGIGANTAIFSLVDALLLRSLPVRSPEELRIVTWVQGTTDAVNSHSGYGLTDDVTGQKLSGSISYPAYLRIRDEAKSLADAVAFAPYQFTVTARNTTDRADGHFVSGNYFSGLGVQPAAGRTILPEDDKPGQPRVAVLTYQYWEKRFGRSPDVVGEKISVNQRPVVVVGVLPPGFQGTLPGREQHVFLPVSMAPETGADYYPLHQQDNWWVQTFVRLRPGVADAQAAAEIRSVLANEIASYRPRDKAPQVLLKPGAKGVAVLRDTFAKPLYVLIGAVAVVLLIACANLAGLLLARGVARQSELALRLSLGASRGRVLRQVCTEGLMLAVAGGLLGLVIAQPLATAIADMAGGTSPLDLDVQLAPRVLAFTALVAVGTGLLFALLPAWRATRIDPAPVLQAGGRQGGLTPRLRLGRVLIAAQVALSLVLLTSAALFLRSLHGLLTTDLGFRAENVLTFQTDASRSGYKGQRLADFYTEVQRRLAAVPGVSSAGMSHRGLMQQSVTMDTVYLPAWGAKPRQALILYCSAPFLSTMQIPVLLGRDLNDGDGHGRPAVAVVNESFAKLYLPEGNPVGRVFQFGSDKPGPPIQVIGVARDAHYNSVRSEVRPTVYRPFMQHLDGLREMTIAMRTTLPTASVAPEIRRTVGEIDGTVPVAEVRTLEQQIERSLGRDRLYASLIAGFGLLALLLAAIGLYGLMAYSAARRTSEIGIRLALGAERRTVQRMMLRDAFWMVLAGVAAGLPVAFASGRLIEAMLYNLEARDPLSTVAAVAVLVAVAGFAAWIPARRASRVDPMAALRN